MTVVVIFNFIILSLYLCCNSFAVRFTFTPSPEANIAAYQQACYKCSVDHSGLTFTWKINGTGSANEGVTKLGIVTYGGSTNSSLTIPGNPQYNNTIVRCNAFGIVNNNSYFNFGESTLRIQGKLTNVENLVCKRENHTCAICTWSPPFSLVPIPGYIVNVTKGFNGETCQNFTADTTWTFCISPSQFDNYTVSVAGNNTAGEGERNNVTIEIKTENLDTDEYNITAKNVSGNWNLTIDIKNKDILRKQHSLLQVELNDSTSVVVKNASGSKSTLTKEIDIGKLPDNKRWELTFRLEYNNGFLISTSTPKNFSTFDVKNGDVTEKNSKTGEVCFTCNFVYGSQAKGCHIEYICTSTGFNGNVTIERTSVDVSTASKCVTGIYTSNYNVTFYDVDYNNIIYTDDYAAKLINKPVTGLSSTPSTNVISSSPSPTSLYTDFMDNSKNSSVNDVIVNVAVFVVLVVLSYIIIS